jgi:hypothetical protein
MQLKNEKSRPGVTGLSEIPRGCRADTESRAFKSFMYHGKREAFRRGRWIANHLKKE